MFGLSELEKLQSESERYVCIPTTFSAKQGLHLIDCRTKWDFFLRFIC